MNKKVIVKLDVETHRKIKILAAMQGVTLSEVINRLVKLSEKLN
ncbi:transcriptional regulator [Caudoviricetes sp.]|nr:transcriptional regulator [Caudoviricetes sp.]